MDKENRKSQNYGPHGMKFLCATFFLLFIMTGCIANKKKLIGLANPSSVNCVNKGGRIQMEKTESGGTYGVCVFKDNKQCEEWALFREECPLGGVEVRGLPEKIRHCVIRGGSLKNEECHFPK
jgi:putative hemolysin